MVDSYRRNYPPTRPRNDPDSPPTKPRNHYDSYHPARDEQRRADGTHLYRRNSLAHFTKDSELSERPGFLSRRTASEYGKQSGLALEDPKSHGQSAPDRGSRTRPTSPAANASRSGAVTPMMTAAPSPLPAKPSSVDVTPTGTPSAASIPTSVQSVSKPSTDPRLVRRLNSQVKENSEIKSASPRSAILVEGKIGSSATDPSILSATPPIIAEGQYRPEQISAAATTWTDVAMVDSDAKEVIEDKTPVASAEDSCDPLGSFVSLLTKVCDTSSLTAFHEYERKRAQEHRDLCRKRDEYAKSNLQGFLPHLEDAQKNRQKAELEYGKLDKKLQDHMEAQNEAVKALANHFMAQLRHQKKSQDPSEEYIEIHKTTSEEVKKLSDQMSIVSGDASEAKAMARKAAGEPLELMNRAIDAYGDAQQNAKKSQIQANKLSERLSAVEEGARSFQRTALQLNNFSERFDRLDHDCNQSVTKYRDRVHYIEESSQILQDDHRRLNDFVKQLEKDARRIPDIVKDVNIIKVECNALHGTFKQLEGDINTLRSNEASSSRHFKTTESLANRLSKLSHDHDGLAAQVKSQHIALNNSLQSQDIQKTDTQRHARGQETLQEQVKNRILDAPNNNIPAAEDTSNDAPSHGLQTQGQGLQSEVEKLQHPSQALSKDVTVLGGPAKIATIQESISSLREQVESLKKTAGTTAVPNQLAEPTPTLSQVSALKNDLERLGNETREVQQKQDARLSALADKLKDCEGSTANSENENAVLGKELDLLQQGQTDMQETFTERYARFESTLAKAEQRFDVKVEATTTDLKAEVESLHTQLQSLAAKVDKVPNVAASSRPTPPSAPPTPHMHTTAQMTELNRASSPSVMENNGVLPLVTKLQADLDSLQNHVVRQLPKGLNLSALNLHNVPAMTQNIAAIHTALNSLNQRYNSLTTEPMVQAMVQQMQLMYPSAATTQAELENLKSVIGGIQGALSTLYPLQAAFDAHTATIAQLNGKVVCGDKEREQLLTLLKEERDKLNHKVQEVTESLNERVREQQDRLKEEVKQDLLKQHDRLKDDVKEDFQKQQEHLRDDVKQDLLKQKDDTGSSIKESHVRMNEMANSFENTTTGFNKELDEVKQSVQTLLARAPSRDGSDTPRSQPRASSKTTTKAHNPSRRESGIPLGTPDDAQRQDLLRRFKPKTSPATRQPPSKPPTEQQVVDDSEGDSDAPLVRRSNSSRVNSNAQSPASSTNTNAYFSASTKRKRGAEEHTPDRRGASEISASPRRGKVARRT